MTGLPAAPAEVELFGSRAGRGWAAAIGLLALLTPFALADDSLLLLAAAWAAGLGAIGMNIITGYAGQLSLAHGFFIGVGAYTAAAVSGDPHGGTLGFGVTFLPVWLLAAGAVAALAGLLVGPVALRLRGLYLAIATVGLVFLGRHVFVAWDGLTGGAGVGRPAAVPQLFGVRFDLDGAMFTRAQKLYWLTLVVLAVFALLARNIVRSDLGRIFAAVRDREVAASMVAVNVTRTKLLAFAISSFYAGVAGALSYPIIGFIDPGSFDLQLSVLYLTMVVVGGVGTISGSVLGALFVTLLPRLAGELTNLLPFVGRSPAQSPNVFQLESVLYGLLLIGFLRFEPRGVLGVALRLRIHWKAQLHWKARPSSP